MCAYAESLDMCPSSSHSDNYFNCIDALPYLSPNFNCEGYIQAQSAGSIEREVHEDHLATTSIDSFSDPIDQQYYFSDVSPIESTESTVESFYECTELTPNPLTLLPHPSWLSFFRSCIWTQFSIMLVVCSSLFRNNLLLI